MTEGLVFGVRLDGAGGGAEVSDRALLPDGPGDVWLHVDVSAPGAVSWLLHHEKLDPLVVDALTATATRPRVTPMGDGIFVVLRGVNLNPGEDPEDMVSLRLYIDERRVVSARRQRIMAVNELRTAIQQGKGPTDTSVILSSIIRNLSGKMSGVLDACDEEADTLEAQLIDDQNRGVRSQLSSLRHKAIALRRHLLPQREALQQFVHLDLAWLTPRDRAHIRECTDQVTRYVEALDEIRERCAVMQDEVMNRMSERMNQTMFLLSVVAAITLPLGLLTGLLGINVGGMPGVDSDNAFTIVVLLMVAILAVEVWVIRRMKWI